MKRIPILVIETDVPPEYGRQRRKWLWTLISIAPIAVSCKFEGSWVIWPKSILVRQRHFRVNEKTDLMIGAWNGMCWLKLSRTFGSKATSENRNLIIWVSVVRRGSGTEMEGRRREEEKGKRREEKRREEKRREEKMKKKKEWKGLGWIGDDG